MNCLLCDHPSASPFKVLSKPERDYFHCERCDLIFMDPEQRLSTAEERARYDFHQNEGTQGYLDFLMPLIKDIDQLVKKQIGDRDQQSTCLDFGSGPTAFLSAQFFARGYLTYNYDIFYYPDKDLLRRIYDVITATEVWEHFHQPKQEIERQVRILKKGGFLGVMTSSHKGEAAFHSWHYRRDLTHICFYSEKTMAWIAEKFDLRVHKSQSPYWIFQKN